MEKFCSPVHVFAFARLSPTVCAVLPLYEPEKVSVPFVAVRALRLEPSAMPEIVEFRSPEFGSPVAFVSTRDEGVP